MVKEIVIPLDGSAEAEITLPYGLVMARKLGAQLDFLTVDETGAADTENLYRNYLQKLDERLKTQNPGMLAWQTRLQKGKAPDEILKFIEEHVVDLVILSAHGASGRGASLIGKVTNKVLTATQRPVLLIKSPPPERDRLIKKIMVPLDGSGIGLAATDLVTALTPAFNAEVVLIQVVEPVRYLPSIDGMGAYTLPIDDAEIETEATTFLNQRAQLLRDKGLTVSTVVKTGPAAETLMNYANENQVDLIAMSTHGLSGLTRWVFGSVTEKIVQYGTLPVLVVHPAGG